jgi:hypothetical protein
MDFHVGIRGNGFTMLCCTAAVQRIIIKDDEEKLVPITLWKPVRHLGPRRAIDTTGVIMTRG